MIFPSPLWFLSVSFFLNKQCIEGISVWRSGALKAWCRMQLDGVIHSQDVLKDGSQNRDQGNFGSCSWENKWLLYDWADPESRLLLKPCN